MHSVCNPEDYQPIRYADSFASEETACVSPCVSIPFSLPTAAGTTFSKGDLQAYLFRDYLRALVYLEPNNGGLNTCSYTALLDPQQFAGSNDALPPAIGQNYQVPIDGFDIPTAYWSPNTSFQPHGPKQYCGIDQELGRGRRYTWIDEAAVVTVSGTLTTGQTVTVIMDQWTSSGVNPASYSVNLTGTFKEETASDDNCKTCKLDTDEKGKLVVFERTVRDIAVLNARFNDPAYQRPDLPGGAASATITVTTGGYYSFRFAELTASQTVTNFSIGYGTVGHVYAHRSSPDYDSFIATIANCRVLAGSLLVQNQTAILNKQGSIVMAQLPEGTDWFAYRNNNAIATASRAYNGNLESGAHGWLRPKAEEDFKMHKDVAVNGTGQLCATTYSLRPRSGYIGVAGNTTDPTDFAGQLRYCQVLEFTSTKQYYSMDTSSIPPNLYREAIDLLKDVVQFHENPLHWSGLIKSIRSAISSVASTITRYGPGALKLASMIKDDLP